jgi:hypothetical protein
MLLLETVLRGVKPHQIALLHLVEAIMLSGTDKDFSLGAAIKGLKAGATVSASL